MLENNSSEIRATERSECGTFLVKVLISTDGTDDNSFEITETANHLEYDGTWYDYGVAINQVDTNNLLIQTGDYGIRYVTTDGTGITIDTESYYYKIKVWKLG